MELGKKEIKKMNTMYQDMLNEVYAYEYLRDTLEEKYYTDALKKVIAERQGHLRILQKLCGSEKAATDADMKYLMRLVKLFGVSRMFKHLSGILEDRAKESEKLSKSVPELKQIAMAEFRFQQTFERLRNWNKG